MPRIIRALSVALLAHAALASQALAPPARADIGALDVVPAATLLVPYFEVDLDDINGITTLFSVVNTAATPVLAKVTYWTDLGVPIFGFHVYLTGQDVQTFNVRDVLSSGFVPSTAPSNFDPIDSISPGGPPGGDDGSIVGCADTDFDLDGTASLFFPPDQVARFQAVFTGEADPLNNGCPSARFGDGYARGYITIDAMNTCTPLLPNQPGYFIAGGGGAASDDNVLTGDFDFIDPQQNFAQGEVAVHIEASPDDPETSVIGETTFYGRLVDWSASDNREPLPTKWAAPAIGTTAHQLIIWRDRKVPVGLIPCGVAPPPPAARQIVVFDTAEDALDVTALGTTLRANTQRVRVGADLPTPFRSGWMYFDFGSSVSPPPIEDPGTTQSVVMAVQSLDPCGGEGRFSSGFYAVPLDSGIAPDTTTLSPPQAVP